jgi:hypothetical protein
MLGWRPEEKSFHLIFGECWHRAMEYLLLNGYSVDAVLEAHRNHFKPLFLSYLDEDASVSNKNLENALVALTFYTAQYRKDFKEFEVLHTEIDARVPISNNRFMSLRMDDILRDMDGFYFSMEHKTGTTHSQLWDEQWELSIQIGTYTHALYCLYPIEMVKGVKINGAFFTKSKSKPIEFNRRDIGKSMTQMEVWLSIVNYWYSQLKSDMDCLSTENDKQSVMLSFSMNPGRCTDWGRVCHYHDFCCTWSNPLKRADQPPLGFTKDFWNPEEREERPKVQLEWGGKSEI